MRHPIWPRTYVILALVALAPLACGSEAPPAGTTSGAAGQGGATTSGTSSSGGSSSGGHSSGGSSSGGGSSTGGSSTGGSSSGGGGGGPVTASCDPLPPPKGNVITVTPSQAGQLHSIVQNVPAGSTVALEPGTYQTSAIIQMLASGVTLRSTTDVATDVVIDGGYQVTETIHVRASDITVAHLTITRSVDHLVHVMPKEGGGNITGLRFYGLRLIDGGEQFIKVNPVDKLGYADDGTVECSTFELTAAGRPHIEPSNGGCYTGGIDAHMARGWVVRQNVFRDIYCDNGGLAEHAVHFWRGSRDTLVENNTIVDCARGIGFGLQNGGGWRLYPDNPYNDPNLAHYDGVIRNNVIYGAIPWYDTGMEIHLTKKPQVHHNTVVTGPGAKIFFSSIDSRWPQTTALIRNNLVTKLTVRDGANPTHEANVENAPLSIFAGPPNDLHLLPGASQAIDKAVPLPNAGLDIDGETHDMGPPDIGADEVQ